MSKDNYNLSILRLKEVIAICKISRSAIYAKIANGTFVKPIKLSERSIGFLAHEIQDWLKDRISASRQEVSR